MNKHVQWVQFSSLAQSCLTFCNPMNRSMPGLPVHHQLLEFTQTHVHWVGDAIQPSHPLSSPSPPAPNLSQHQSLFQWVNSSHEARGIARCLGSAWLGDLYMRGCALRKGNVRLRAYISWGRGLLMKIWERVFHALETAWAKAWRWERIQHVVEIEKSFLFLGIIFSKGRLERDEKEASSVAQWQSICLPMQKMQETWV